MNSIVLVNTARFILLLALQVVVFSRINLFGFINPFPYILFILLYPVNGNRAILLISSFFLGLVMDIFLNSGGSHAAACVTLAYLRPSFFKFSFGISYEYQTIRINDRITQERFLFIVLSIVTHHLILYLLEFFRFSLLADALLHTLCATVFTLAVTTIIVYLIKPAGR